MALLTDAEPTTEETSAPTPHSGSKLTLWLVGFSFLGLVLPLFLIATSLQEDNTALLQERAALEATLGLTPTVDPTITALDAELGDLRTQIDEMRPLAQSLTGEQPDWLAVSVTIGSYDPAHIQIMGVEQTGMTLSITGHASSERTAIAYLHQLQESGTFTRVTVQSITLLGESTTQATEEAERLTEFVLRIELRGTQDG